MAEQNHIPYFFRPRVASRIEKVEDHLDHYDLLAFLSIAVKFKVDILDESWHTGLPALGGGATSIVAQSSLDVWRGLAFKIPAGGTTAFPAADTEQGFKERFKALIYELVALESLRSNPYVTDLTGITWEVDPESGLAWPVFLTERSALGSLDDFLLSERGESTSSTQKLKLCSDVAKACYAMHRLGIIYGDLKPENILVFEEPGDLASKAIDFGYSCFGASSSALVKVPRTRPYQAPEHELDKLVPWKAAQKMDIFSFGFLVCRLLVWEGFSSDDLDDIDEMKRTPRFLELAKEALESSTSVSEQEKGLVRTVFSMTLNCDPSARAVDFGQIIAIMDPGYHFQLPEASMTDVDELSRDIVEIRDVLNILDRADYIVRQTLFRDLRRRATTHRNCICFQPSAKQLWFCYEIGMGTKRGQRAASKWLSECNDISWNPEDYIKSVNSLYQVGYLDVEDRIHQLLGYDTASPSRLYTVYVEQNRLGAAEKKCRQELEGRERSMGDHSRPYLAQLMILSMILTESGQLDEALQTARLAASRFKETYGSNDVGTIEACTYLANVLFSTARFEEVEKVQLELISAKDRILFNHPIHRTHGTSRIMLAAAYYFQGRYDKCLSTAAELLEAQLEHLDRTHPDTLTSRLWICQARLVKDDMSELLSDTRELVQDYESTVGESGEDTIIAQELLSRVLLALAKPEPPAPTVDEFLDESLEIVVRVLNEIEDPGGSDASSTSSRSASIIMEDADADPDESASHAAPRDLTGVNFTLLLQAHTTFICGMGFKKDFEAAHQSIAVVGSEDFLHQFGNSHIDVIRLRRVLGDIRKLETLAMLNPKERDNHLIDQLLWRLAHRWDSDTA